MIEFNMIRELIEKKPDEFLMYIGFLFGLIVGLVVGLLIIGLVVGVFI